VNKEKYRFPDEVKDVAFQRLLAKGKQDIHHIVSRSTARKYNLDPERIASQENAIALEQDGIHAWIHGKQISQIDEEMDWQGFEDADYIDLAIGLLGFKEEDFKKIYPKRRRKKKRKRR